VQHTTEIKMRGNITVHIDHKQRGVGGDDSWGTLPHDEYRLLNKQYSYSYTISLIDKIISNKILTKYQTIIA
jgi:beta-galactosidase